jgi:hypothetical protein
MASDESRCPSHENPAREICMGHDRHIHAESNWFDLSFGQLHHVRLSRGLEDERNNVNVIKIWIGKLRRSIDGGWNEGSFASGTHPLESIDKRMIMTLELSEVLT